MTEVKVINERMLLMEAEIAIERVLLELENELIPFGKRIDFVDVDTRSFANMKTEIITIVKVR